MTVPTACVIGWPIAHSRSPIIHRYWLKTLSIAGDYVAMPVRPEELAGFLAGPYRSRYVGGNVTVPHKEAALAGVSDIDAVAAALGAVNTLWVDDGRLYGSNTDPEGFLANLDERGGAWAKPGKAALVLGAGGAARAVVWALLVRGFDPVVVLNRTEERAKAIAARFGHRVRGEAWGRIGDWLSAAELLVNTTSLGMAGQPGLEIDLGRLRPDAVVTDLVYAPLETQLLRDARRRGHPAVDGLGMLLHQAVPGFERWFGRRPNVTTNLRELVVADIVRP